MLDSVTNLKKNEFQPSLPVKGNNISYRGGTKSLERVPEQDVYKKKKGLGIGAKIGLGTLGLAGVLIAIDRLVLKGKYTDDILNFFKRKADAVVPDGVQPPTNSVQKEFDQIDVSNIKIGDVSDLDDVITDPARLIEHKPVMTKKVTDDIVEATANSVDETESAIQKNVQEYLELEDELKISQTKYSNMKNEKWLQKQHILKEKEYSDFWNNALDEKEKALKKSEQKVKTKKRLAAKKSLMKEEKALRAELEPVIEKLKIANDSLYYCYRNPEATIDEMQKALDDYLMQLAKYSQLEKKAPKKLSHLFDWKYNSITDRMHSKIQDYRFAQKTVDDFEIIFKETIENSSDGTFFSRDFYNHYEKISEIANDSRDLCKEHTVLKEKCKNYVDLINNKIEINPDKMDERTGISTILEQLNIDQQRFEEEQLLRMQREFEEMSNRVFSDYSDGFGGNII